MKANTHTFGIYGKHFYANYILKQNWLLNKLLWNKEELQA